MYYYSESYYHEEREMANDPRYDAVYERYDEIERTDEYDSSSECEYEY